MTKLVAVGKMKGGAGPIQMRVGFGSDSVDESAQEDLEYWCAEGSAQKDDLEYDSVDESAQEDLEYEFVEKRRLRNGRLKDRTKVRTFPRVISRSSPVIRRGQ